MSPRRRKKAAEAIRAYGRLAGILNCYTWRRWLEDMAFPFAYPEIYADVKRKIDREPAPGTRVSEPHHETDRKYHGKSRG